MNSTHWHIRIDTGGTFTDCIAIGPDGSRRHIKVLSNSSLRGTILSRISPRRLKIKQQWQIPADFIKGLELVTFGDNRFTGAVTAFNPVDSTVTLEKALPDDTLWENTTFEIHSTEEAPVLAARIATGTRPGEPLPRLRMRLATTKGTNALLERKGAPTLLLITKGFGDFPEIGDQKRPDLFSIRVRKPEQLYDKVIEIPERLDAEGTVLSPPDIRSCSIEIRDFLKQDSASVAVCLMHSYKNNRHEIELKKSLEEDGAEFISCSSDMSPFIKLLPRLQTTVVNAYLDPVLRSYLHSVNDTIGEGSLYVMTSAAGLVSAADFKPKDSLLSGPAGGVVGAGATGRELGYDSIISFDMGGTSTDVARYDDGYDYQFEHRVGGARIKAPALAIETVAAGGGSVCGFDGYKLTVGPESAGAWPGPACYGAEGPLTLTDVNLLMGRLQPDNFSIPVSPEAAEKRLNELIQQLKKAEKPYSSRQELLAGFLQIANERMADAVRKISLQKGYDPSEYALVAFGGAGAQHATAISQMLDIGTVLVPEKAGLLSAFGLDRATIEQFAERQILAGLDELRERLSTIVKQLEEEALQKLRRQLDDEDVSLQIRRRLIFMRLSGQESTLEIEFNAEIPPEEQFREAYRARYGHRPGGRTIEVESIRVVASTVRETDRPAPLSEDSGEAEPVRTTDVQFGAGISETPLYERAALKPGHRINGPAIVLDPYSTTVVEPGWHGTIRHNGTLVLENSQSAGTSKPARYTESINLELFTHRFTTIAEEMGEMMRRTALSVNVKERLDFSCALLNPDGELVVNAPHIPVHLGALGLCVRTLKQKIPMSPGDVVVTNHPSAGGSHLPDITVVAPVFNDGDTLLGYAACRAHHAEIGGKRPGSMPPDATTLHEEGVVIPPLRLLESGKPNWNSVRDILCSAEFPSRAVEENIADLQAAVAANNRGVQALQKLARQEGTETVLKYMAALKEHSARKTRQMLGSLPDISTDSREYLDDGTVLNAAMEKKEDHLFIDFSGTGKVHPGNLNATPAIVQSVVMYVLRLFMDEPLPLNEGLLDPVTIELPTCLLNPRFSDDPHNCPAVVGGNTETSQRLVDLLLKPFEKAACSQGTMNNVLFGNERFGYYETIGGGTGAGCGFHGSHAVHHHMTNTAGTDPEILEHRYPVRLDNYSIRRQSGGNGTWRGGDGIIRELTFLAPVSLSVLTQHRKEAPYGLQGGEPGRTGKQYIIRSNGSKKMLEPIDGADLKTGDRFVIETPGGGGYGN